MFKSSGARPEYTIDPVEMLRIIAKSSRLLA